MTTLLRTVPADQEARRVALTDRQHGLLVEAGAGSGKTAILAGRVALLIADGVEPRSIAAITFTELAAAELASRAVQYVHELVQGRVPVTIAAAFPDGVPSAEQQDRLRAALGTLDELTCTTIHGFARELLRPYPVEADIDPGATVLDGTGQEALLERVFEDWQREVLDGTNPEHEQLARILTAPGAPGRDNLLKMLERVREHGPADTHDDHTHSARSAAATELGHSLTLLERLPAAAQVLSGLSGSLHSLRARLSDPDCDRQELLRTRRDPAIHTRQGLPRALRVKTAWVRAAVADGLSGREAAEVYGKASRHYEAYRTAYRQVLEAPEQDSQQNAAAAPAIFSATGHAAAEELRRCMELLQSSASGGRLRADRHAPWENLRTMLLEEQPDPVALLAVQHSRAIFTQKNRPLKNLKIKGDWVKAAQADGMRHDQANSLYDAAHSHYDAFVQHYDELLQAAADHVLQTLTDGLRDVDRRYRQEKRTAALLDFADLIDTTVALLRNHPDVRAELAGRYAHVLIDEFQDTDPKQAEIVWRLTGIPDGDDWRRWRTRAGSRFVVGDPKQSIYRFRGADALTYADLSDSLESDDGARRLGLTTNFRSKSGIIDAVNASFSEPLSAEFQPGYEKLATWHGAGPGVAVRRLHVADGTCQYADERREVEAAAVADLILSLLEEGNGLTDGPVKPGDIALLTPTSTGVDIFERALDERGINVSSQAGKGFWRRQEVQDLVALTRTLAEPRDTLALGALLKGPLVGATLEELLDVAELLHGHDGDDGGDDGQALNVLTDPTLLPDGVIRHTLEKLQPLVQARFTVTPFVLLSRAIEALEVRAVLGHRHGSHSERATANLERFLEESRRFAVGGFGEFARHVSAAWSDQESELEGRADSSEDAVTLITIHSAKGLEWKVVIPVDMAAETPGKDSIFHDRETDRLLTRVFRQECSGYAEAQERVGAEQQAERTRLWYVTATRARELLVLPEYEAKTEKRAWCRLVDWQLPETELLDPGSGRVRRPQAQADTAQTREAFQAENEAIQANLQHIERRAPSRRDEENPDGEKDPDEAERFILDEAAAGLILAALDEEDPGTGTPEPLLAVGTARGIVLHRLMEELISGLTAAEEAPLAARATELTAQLRLEAGALKPAEIAELALRAWHVPEVAALHGRLLAEVEVAGVDPDTGAHWGGIADAVALAADGTVEAVLDWKSDRQPAPETISHYRQQLRAYLHLTGATVGLIVMAETGEVITVAG